MSRKAKEEQLPLTPDEPNQMGPQVPDADQQPPVPPEVKEPETITVKWAVNVKHNQHRYRAGEKTEITAEEYPELLRAKVIIPQEE
ncbi:hypothetical protein PV433_11455 [Paenibacillus sp. GYB004]|uniref:DUF7210 family protein n=1 Tax=Paenibacillus sp. GYB004 TaxID=2994393 RepID=UPI002F96C807